MKKIKFVILMLSFFSLSFSAKGKRVLVDNFEDGNHRNEWGGYWFTFDDRADVFGEIEPVTLRYKKPQVTRENPTCAYVFPPPDPTGTATPYQPYPFGVKGSKYCGYFKFDVARSSFQYAYVAFGTNFVDVGQNKDLPSVEYNQCVDLSEYNGIAFWMKVSDDILNSTGRGKEIKIKLTYKLAPGTYGDVPKEVGISAASGRPLSNDWQFYVILFDKLQDGGWPYPWVNNDNYFGDPYDDWEPYDTLQDGTKATEPRQSLGREELKDKTKWPELTLDNSTVPAKGKITELTKGKFDRIKAIQFQTMGKADGARTGEVWVDDIYLIKYDTAAWKVDTDGDGWNDYEEFAAGTDPNDPNSYPVAYAKTGKSTDQDAIISKVEASPSVFYPGGGEELELKDGKKVVGGRTVIKIVLSQNKSGTASIKIYNSAGKLVADKNTSKNYIVEQPITNGIGIIAWSGFDNEDKLVPPGIYIIRAEINVDGTTYVKNTTVVVKSYKIK